MNGITVDRHGLLRHFGLVAAGFGLALGVIVTGIATVGGTSVAAKWALPTVTIAGLELAYLYRHLGANHPDGETGHVYESMGVANSATLFRGGLFAAVAGFVFLEPAGWIAWFPALLYGTGSALDWIDGTLARASERMTVLGDRLDGAFDALGFLVAPVVGVLWGRLPIWYLSLSAARYLFVAGKIWRRRRGYSVFDLPTSRVRRPLAGLQMAFITVALAPVLPAETVHTIALVVLPPSLVVFLRDYLVVAGHLDGAEQ